MILLQVVFAILLAQLVEHAFVQTIWFPWRQRVMLKAARENGLFGPPNLYYPPVGGAVRNAIDPEGENALVLVSGLVAARETVSLLDHPGVLLQTAYGHRRGPSFELPDFPIPRDGMFWGTKLAIDATCVDHFEVQEIRVGDVPLTNGHTPARSFVGPHGAAVLMPGLDPHTTITIVVANVSDQPQEFRAKISGRYRGGVAAG